MVKTQVSNKTRGRRTRRRKQPRAPSNDRQLLYAQLLSNPDNGHLPSDGIYDGELGNFRRFVNSSTYGTGGNTCGCVMFYPATGTGHTWTADAAITAPITVINTVGMPGATYLGNNAAKSRGIAAKLEIIPSAASFSSITGEVCAGVATRDNLPTSGISVNNVFDAAKAYGPITRKTVAARWFPSGLDHTYSPYGNAPDEDRNGVFVAWRGWPAGVPMTVRITYIVEFTIRPALGIPPTGAVSNPVGHHEVISAIQHHDPHWHHSILDEVKEAGLGIVKDAGVFARGMARAGLSHLGSNMLKQAPRALPLLLA